MGAYQLPGDFLYVPEGALLALLHENIALKFNAHFLCGVVCSTPLWFGCFARLRLRREKFTYR